MASCIRYSVAVYLGLLLAGALFTPRPEPAAWAVYGEYWWSHTPPIVRPQQPDAAGQPPGRHLTAPDALAAHRRDQRSAQDAPLR